jgi:hypothetical protein
MTPTDTELRSLRSRGYRVQVVAEMFGIDYETLRQRYADLYSTERVPDPTPLEIKQRCAEIQREWSASERRQRSVYKGGGWTPTVVPASVVTSATNYASGCTALYAPTPPSATSSGFTATRRGRAE